MDGYYPTFPPEQRLLNLLQTALDLFTRYHTQYWKNRVLATISELSSKPIYVYCNLVE